MPAIATRARLWILCAGAGTLLFLIYAWTAPRTITWWEGSSWTLEAVTLGVAPPPGSLILTLLGWVVSMIPLGIAKAYELNLFNAAIAVAMLGVLCLVALRTSRSLRDRSKDEIAQGWPEVAAVAGCLLTLGLSYTIWRYAFMFSPYILTGGLTAMLLWALLRWWEKAESTDAIRWLFVLGLLVGLDFSVHRTNLLMIPGLIAGILLRRPKVLMKGRAWSAAGVGLLLGLSVHFLLIPAAARGPAVNMDDPSTLSRFYDYVSLKQFGGGWLVNLWPRQGPFLEHQVNDYVKAFAANFSNTSGPLGVLGILPLLAGVFGAAVIWRSDRRLAIALMILFLCMSLGAVVYFNLPARFPYPMDRHYIPSFLLFGLFMTIGAKSFVSKVSGGIRRFSRPAAIVGALTLCVMPIAQFAANFRLTTSSHDKYAHEYAMNILTTVEPRAIVFVQGDNIWPLLYLQLVEGIRRDVSIVSPSLTNTSWYVQQIVRRPPGVPLALTPAELDSIGIIHWPKDSVVTVPARGGEDEKAASRSSTEDFVHLHVPASVLDRYLFPQDWLLVRMIVDNRWERPIYFTEVPAWLERHSRTEGLVDRLVPTDSATVDCILLQRNVMERYSYSGFPGEDVLHGWMTAAASRTYARGFRSLIECQNPGGDTAQSRQTSDRLRSLFPDNTLR